MANGRSDQFGGADEGVDHRQDRHFQATTLREVAVASGDLIAEQGDRWVRPEMMTHTYR